MKKDQFRQGKALPKATLGKRRDQPFTYTPRLLEAVPLSVGRHFACDSLWVTLDCLRFTSLCPVTGQPDWAELTINYLPDSLLVESKSLKEYLTSFRMHGDFHEDVCRIVCDDLAACVKPRYVEVVGIFDHRGSIAIWPYAQYARPGDAFAQQVCEHRLLHYTPGAWSVRREARPG